MIIIKLKVNSFFGMITRKDVGPGDIFFKRGSAVAAKAT